MIINFTIYSDLNKIADGIGHKFGLFQYGISGFICGYILAFIYGWKLTLVMLSLFPIMAATGGALGMVCFKPPGSIYFHHINMRVVAVMFDRGTKL